MERRAGGKVDTVILGHSDQQDMTMERCGRKKEKKQNVRQAGRLAEGSEAEVR